MKCPFEQTVARKLFLTFAYQELALKQLPDRAIVWGESEEIRRCFMGATFVGNDLIFYPTSNKPFCPRTAPIPNTSHPVKITIENRFRPLLGKADLLSSTPFMIFEEAATHPGENYEEENVRSNSYPALIICTDSSCSMSGCRF